MTHLFDIPYLLTTYGYLGIFVIVFLESGIFFPLPGDSLLFTAGILATALGLHILVLIPLIFLATFLGALFGYYVGEQIDKLHKFSFFRKVLSQEHINTAHNFFVKHGLFAIIFSRFVPVVRTFMPIVAGMAKMHYRTFINYSLVSAVLWSSVVTSLGYFLGRTFPQIKDYLSYTIILIIFVSILPALFGWLRGRKRTI